MYIAIFSHCLTVILWSHDKPDKFYEVPAKKVTYDSEARILKTTWSGARIAYNNRSFKEKPPLEDTGTPLLQEFILISDKIKMKAALVNEGLRWGVQETAVKDANEFEEDSHESRGVTPRSVDLDYIGIIYIHS